MTAQHNCHCGHAMGDEEHCPFCGCEHFQGVRCNGEQFTGNHEDCFLQYDCQRQRESW